MKTKRFALLPLVLLICGCAPSSPKGFLTDIEPLQELPEVDQNRLLASTSLRYAQMGAEYDGNYVYSPLGLALSLAGTALASNGSEKTLSELGISEEGYLSLVRSLNFDFKREPTGPGEQGHNSSLRCFAFLQAIGGNVSVNEEEASRLAELGISNISSSFKTYKDDAQAVLDELSGRDMPMPNFEIPADFDAAAACYSGVSLIDSREEAGTIAGEFASYYGESIDEVDCQPIDGLYRYYDGEGFQAMRFGISVTDMTIVLPDEGVGLEEISLSDAASEFEDNAKATLLEGYVPYFKLTSQIDYTPYLGQFGIRTPLFGRFVTSLPLTGVICLQKTEFEFAPKGVDGKSVTVTAAFPEAGDVIGPEPIEFDVNRPFYFVSSYRGMPIFAGSILSL